MKAWPEEEDGVCLGWEIIHGNCKIIQHGALKEKIRGWIWCLWFKMVAL